MSEAGRYIRNSQTSISLKYQKGKCVRSLRTGENFDIWIEGLSRYGEEVVKLTTSKGVKVKDKETGKIYNSITECSKALGIHRGAIRWALAKNMKMRKYANRFEKA